MPDSSPPSSPNKNARPDGSKVTMLILHYTDTKTTQEALDILCAPERKVSAHYVLEENGNIIPLVDETQRAWHAGVSHWHGRDNINDVSIGIELVNPGERYGYRPFPQEQLSSLIELCQGILKRHPIPARYVLAHSDIAPERKIDPGELFDWRQLAQAGIGLYPSIPVQDQRGIFEIGMRKDGIKHMQRQLQQFGYAITPDGYFGVNTAYVVEAFQRHYIQTRLDGVWDATCQTMLDALLQSV